MSNFPNGALSVSAVWSVQLWCRDRYPSVHHHPPGSPPMSNFANGAPSVAPVPSLKLSRRDRCPSLHRRTRTSTRPTRTTVREAYSSSRVSWWSLKSSSTSSCRTTNERAPFSGFSHFFKVCLDFFFFFSKKCFWTPPFPCVCALFGKTKEEEEEGNFSELVSQRVARVTRRA